MISTQLIALSIDYYLITQRIFNLRENSKSKMDPEIIPLLPKCWPFGEKNEKPTGSDFEIQILPYQPVYPY